MSLALGLAISGLAAYGLGMLLLRMTRALARAYRRVAWGLGTMRARWRMRQRSSTTHAHLQQALGMLASAQVVQAQQAQLIVMLGIVAAQRKGTRP